MSWYGVARLTAVVVVAAGLEAGMGPARGPGAQDEITFEQELAWSPDGLWIAFAAMTLSRARWEKERYGALADGQYDLFIVRADGTAHRRLTDHPGYDLWLSWSPDGKRIVFGSKRADDTDLYVIGAAGSGLTRLTSDPADESGPAWSPSGSRIAFTVREPDDSWRLYMMNTDGSQRRRLTSGSGNDHNPVWSPDGAHLAFYSDRDGPGQDAVYVIDPDGTGERRITSGIYPGWSADGSALVIGTAEGLFAVRLEDGGRSLLARGSEFGRWSPDGTRLAFIAGEFPDTRIYVAHADGTNPVPITR